MNFKGDFDSNARTSNGPALPGNLPISLKEVPNMVETFEISEHKIPTCMLNTSKNLPSWQ